MTRKPAESAEARDLRDLLAAVLDALTLDHGVDGYDQRISERAGIAKVIVREALAAGPAEFGWNADWLRQKLREEEARHKAGEQR